MPARQQVKAALYSPGRTAIDGENWLSELGRRGSGQGAGSRGSIERAEGAVMWGATAQHWLGAWEMSESTMTSPHERRRIRQGRC